MKHIRLRDIVTDPEFQRECAEARERVFVAIAERRAAERQEAKRSLAKPLPDADRKYGYDRPFPAPAAPAKPHDTSPRPTPKPQPEPEVRKRTRRNGPQEAFGQSMTYQEWANHLGISVNNLHGRIHRAGSLEAAVELGGPVNRKRAGVGQNFQQEMGTGAGTRAQDFSELEFSE